MKSIHVLFILPCVFVAAQAVVNLSTQQVFDNCPLARTHYTNFNAAFDKCFNITGRAPGLSSCVAKEMNFLSNDCCNVDVTKIEKTLDPTSYNACKEEFPLNPLSGSWYWHGNCKFVDIDTKFDRLLSCYNNVMIMMCQDTVSTFLDKCPLVKL